jgi:hypothetical protein
MQGSRLAKWRCDKRETFESGERKRKQNNKSRKQRQESTQKPEKETFESGKRKQKAKQQHMKAMESKRERENEDDANYMRK